MVRINCLVPRRRRSDVKIAAVCCTYLRPKWLGWMIRCFEKQDHPNRELVILDDAGQYDQTNGDRWRLVSEKDRYPSLAEKRNAAACLVSDDVDALAIWDDDDLYLPWALSATVAALENGEWSCPSVVLELRSDGSFWQHKTDRWHNAHWGFRREVFWRVGGYPLEGMSDQDWLLRERCIEAGVIVGDPVSLGWKPFFVNVRRWRGKAETRRLSTLRRDGYKWLGRFKVKHTKLKVTDPLLDLDNIRIVPGVHTTRGV